MNSANDNRDGQGPDHPYGSNDDRFGSDANRLNNPFEIQSSFAPPLGGSVVNAFCSLVVISLVCLIFFMQRQNKGPSVPHSPQADLAELTFQSKIMLGFEVVSAKNPMFQEDQEEQPGIRFGQFGSVRMRQAGAVMVAELESNEDALVVLAALEKKAAELNYQFTEAETRTNQLLQTLFQDSVDALTPLEKEHLQTELLWFGHLALNPESRKAAKPNRERNKILEGAESTLYTVAGLTFLVLVCLVVGFVGSIVMAVLYRWGKLQIRTSNVSGETSIYLESFTVWLATFVLFSLILGVVAPQSNPLVANGIVFLTSLAAGLMWAVFRGKFGVKGRTDVGYCGNPLQEFPVAVWCYVCSLPLVAFGLIVSSLLVLNFSSGGPDGLQSSGPAHPILEWIMSGDSMTIGMVFFVACFCAPVVEETMFRGFLYRSLRDGSHKSGHFASALFSALVNGLLFAAIHPQGVFLIPGLCALGMGFSFAREWRGSLWAPMFMHAIHNGILTATLVFVVSA